MLLESLSLYFEGRGSWWFTSVALTLRKLLLVLTGLQGYVPSVFLSKTGFSWRVFFQVELLLKPPFSLFLSLTYPSAHTGSAQGQLAVELEIQMQQSLHINNCRGPVIIYSHATWQWEISVFLLKTNEVLYTSRYESKISLAYSQIPEFLTSQNILY